MVETASKSIHNWRRYPSSKCYEIDEKVRFGIWWSAVAPSVAAEKNRNIGAQPQSVTCTTAPKIFWKIHFLYDFWCAQTCSFRAIFEIAVRNLTFAVSAIQWHAEKLYRCTSTLSAVKYCSGMLFKSVFYLYEVVRTNFFVDFWTLRNFPPKFREYCGAP